MTLDELARGIAYDPLEFPPRLVSDAVMHMAEQECRRHGFATSAIRDQVRCKIAATIAGHLAHQVAFHSIQCASAKLTQAGSTGDAA